VVRNRPGDLSVSDSRPFATKCWASLWKIRARRSLDTELWGTWNSRASNKSFGQEAPIRVGISILCDILGRLSPTTLFTIKRAGDEMQGLSPLFLIYVAVGHQEKDYNCRILYSVT
jgi:hypothetical protein